MPVYTIISHSMHVPVLSTKNNRKTLLISCRKIIAIWRRRWRRWGNADGDSTRPYVTLYSGHAVLVLCPFTAAIQVIILPLHLPRSRLLWTIWGISSVQPPSVVVLPGDSQSMVFNGSIDERLPSIIWRRRCARIILRRKNRRERTRATSFV